MAWVFAGRAKPFCAFWSPCLPLPVNHAQGEASAISCVGAVGRAALLLVCSNGGHSGFAHRCWQGGGSSSLFIAVRDLGAVLPTRGIRVPEGLERALHLLG